MPFKRIYRKKYRRRGGRSSEMAMGERKLSINTPLNLTDPANGTVHTSTSAAAIIAASTGGATETEANKFPHFFVAGSDAEPDTKALSVQFGSRSRVNYDATAGVPPAGSFADTPATSIIDGSFPLVLHPESYGGVNNVNMQQYTGRKYATTSVVGKVTFFHASSGDFASEKLWDNETIIDVYLLCIPDAERNLQLSSSLTAKHITARYMFEGPGTGSYGNPIRDYAVNKFIHVNSKGSFKILRKWRLELAAANADSEPFLPWEFSHVFKKPLVTAVDQSASSNSQGDGRNIRTNLLQLLFVARGAVEMNYEIRHYFRDI